MHCLPPLLTGAGRWLPPMADRSADVLAECLLQGNAPPLKELPSKLPSESLAEALSGDPPLALWVACTAAELDDYRPTGVEGLALWLADHLPGVLGWDLSPDTPLQPDATAAESYADRVEQCLLRAELAAQLAAESGKPAGEMAFLLGLLHDATNWLAVDDDAPAHGRSPLPEWLSNADDAAAVAALRMAVEVLGGETPPEDSPRLDLDACRQRAAEGRRRWLAPGNGLGNWLPGLAARLTRLDVLENRFQETLESEKLEAMAEFAAGAGHEINNPLTVIAGRAQLFLREETDPERRRALALMNSQAMRVHEMIADMMLFARPPVPAPEKVDVVELIDGLIEEMTPQAAGQETALRRTGESESAEIEVDPTQLTMALKAMVQNSLEAIGRSGQIEVAVRPGRKTMEIRVADDGPGMTAEERRHVFDPYYSARQAGRGLGLGLSKAWRIVTNHGGQIDVDVGSGRGIAFTIRLPNSAIVAT